MGHGNRSCLVTGSLKLYVRVSDGALGAGTDDVICRKYLKKAQKLLLCAKSHVC